MTNLMNTLLRRRPPLREPRPAPLRRVDGRPPPHDLDAERAVLYVALNDRGAAEFAAGRLEPQDFYDQTHARVFEAIQKIVKGHKAPELVTVVSWLKEREWQPPEGGWSDYVYGLWCANAEASVPRADQYVAIVVERSQRRRIIATCQRFGNEGYFDVGDGSQWASEVATTFAEIAHRPEQSEPRPLADVLKNAFEEITAAAERGDRITGLATGYDRLDGKTAGMHEGDLIIVAGRPGMGKTSFVLNIATNVASPRTKIVDSKEVYEPGIGVCVFSLEMPQVQLATRMACSEARVDLGRVRQGQLHAHDWRKLTESASYLSTLPIWIDDSPGLTVLELRAKVRKKQSEYNREPTHDRPGRRVGLIVVDYLQLMSGDAETREQEIAGISRGLKNLAKELKMPVIALSQLNRAVETRSTKDKRPQLSDLRESGAVEQDADTIIFIYRDDYYNPETSDLKGIAELIIAKQRNGPTGKVKVRFSASCTRFDNLEPGEAPESQEDE